MLKSVKYQVRLTNFPHRFERKFAKYYSYPDDFTICAVWWVIGQFPLSFWWKHQAYGFRWEGLCIYNPWACSIVTVSFCFVVNSTQYVTSSISLAFLELSLFRGVVKSLKFSKRTKVQAGAFIEYIALFRQSCWGRVKLPVAWSYCALCFNTVKTSCRIVFP